MIEATRKIETDKLRWIVDKISHVNLAKAMNMSISGAKRIYMVLDDKSAYLTEQTIKKVKKALDELQIPWWIDELKGDK